MEHTVSYLMEPLLTQYFLIDAICQGFLDDGQRHGIFRELARVFYVPLTPETEVYYVTANLPQYKSITDYTAYERLCRTIEFAEASGQDVQLTAVDRMILAQKREALTIKSELFKQSRNLTRDTIAETLLRTAMNGNVDAMVTLAYMEYHGICICKDGKNARKRMRLCARWNHLSGNLMGIAYDKKNAADYCNNLYTILRSATQREVQAYIFQCVPQPVPAEKKPVALVLEQAFDMGIIQRNTYDPIFAKVAFSDLISIEDKEKLLLNKKKDAIVSLSGIPFDADRTALFQFDAGRARDIPLERPQELEQALCAISPAIQHRPDLYRTLLVTGDDDYVSEMYITALRNGFSKETKLIEVDAGLLTLQDFIGAKEHFVLRGLSETKQSHTVFVIRHCNEIGERELEELMKLLDYRNRQKFKLQDPAVSLDLSDVLFVLFASENNELVRRLSAECDTVWTARISEAEKQTVIESVFRARSRCFGIGKIRLEAACRTYLATFKTGQIRLILDSALKKAAYDHSTVITAQTLKTISDQQNITVTRREFGFQGGAFHEEY